MHTAHEGKQTGSITMVCISGIFIIGNLISGNKLINPRHFAIIEEGKRIQMSSLPGNPSWINIGSNGFRYLIPDTEKNILDLYDRVTHPVPVPNPEPSNLIKMQ